MIGIGAVAAAVFIFGYVTRLRSKGAVDEYKERLRAAGEKLEVNELIPAKVSAEQNGAALLREAGKLADTSGTFFFSNPPTPMRIIAAGKAMVRWRQPDVRDVDGTNSWDEAGALLARHGLTMDLLRQGTARRTFDFELNYRQGFTLLLPHLVEMKRSAQLLSVASVCDLHHGDVPSAATNADMILALVRNWKTEPLVISQLVRIAMAQIALGPTWELLQSPGLSDEQLAMLQADWAELEFVEPAENALRMERALAEISLANVRTSNSALESLIYYEGSPGSTGSSGNWLEDLSDYGKSVWRGTKLKTKELLWRVSWSFADELRMLRGEQVLIDTVRLARTNGCFREALAQQETNLAKLGFTVSGREFEFLAGLALYGNDPADMDVRGILSSSVVSLSGYPRRLLVAEATKQLAVTALALKRYQLRRGNYPGELSALTPEFLSQVPRDPVDGRPLRYRLKPDGTFLLYSIGDDATDDGGDPHPSRGSSLLSWQRGRDWVWPQPATVAEIESFESKPSSRRP